MFNKKEYMKQYRQKNKERIKKYNKKYNTEHGLEIQIYWSNYWAKHKDEINKWRKENHIHKPRIKIIHSEEWHEERRKRAREYQKINSKRLNTSKEGKARHLKYFKKRYRTDFQFKLNSNMAVAIGQALKGKKAGRKWETLVGYTCNDLIGRLKKTMPNGYSWDDFLRGKLHVDHIIPKSIFNYTKSEHIDFKRCWALSNLRLLPAQENRIKNAKLSRPFQPALAIEF